MSSVTVDDISIIYIYVTAQRYAGGLMNMFDLPSGSHAIDIQ